MQICQSCSMPMTEEDHFGTEKDGSKNRDYCVYCYQGGAFTAEITMEEMIDFCAAHVENWNRPITKEEAMAEMREIFPQLKRWAVQ